jgi:hypothetical protein
VVQVKARKAILAMDYLDYLVELHGTSREMDTELFGVLLSLMCNRDRLQDHHRRAFSGNLAIKHQLPVTHRTLRGTISELNRRKHESVHYFKVSKRESLEHSFHHQLLSHRLLFFFFHPKAASSLPDSFRFLIYFTNPPVAAFSTQYLFSLLPQRSIVCTPV